MAWGRHPSLSLTNCVIDIPVFSVLVIMVDAIPLHMYAITSVDVIRGGYITSCIFGDVSWLLLCGIHVYGYGIHVRHCSPLALFFLTFCIEFFCFSMSFHGSLYKHTPRCTCTPSPHVMFRTIHYNSNELTAKAGIHPCVDMILAGYITCTSSIFNGVSNYFKSGTLF